MVTEENPVKAIIDKAGGAVAVAGAIDGIKADAVYKWTRNGIPEWHWQRLMDLTGTSLNDIYEANRVLRGSKAEANGIPGEGEV